VHLTEFEKESWPTARLDPTPGICSASGRIPLT
jgi:hypothetical protein